MANEKNRSVHILAESAIMIALATVLSMIKVYEAPYGGSVTLLSMAPIIILSMRRGVKTGLVAGFVHSLIQLLLGLNNVAWVPTPGGIVLCESETGLVLPAEVGSLTLKKQYKYGKVLLWKYTKPMAAEEETGGVEE